MSRIQRRRQKRPSSLLLPQGAGTTALRATMGAYVEWMAIRQYTAPTIRTRADSLGLFACWCETRSLHRPEEVTRPILERYQRHLFLYRKQNGRPLGAGTQCARLLAVRRYFQWMVKTNRLLSNPASDLEMPRRARHLPYFVLTPTETDTIINQPDVSTPMGVRDRAILETLYSTGMRRMELANLSVFSVRADQGVVNIREGKGRKDRVVPIGERAIGWIEKYQAEVRPQLVMPPDPGNLFLTEYGQAFNLSRLTNLVRAYVQASGVAPRGACHLFRHVMATQMLENGADVRFIQAILGHASLESTQVYTQVSIRKLKEIHAATHPSAKLGRAVEDGEGLEIKNTSEGQLHSALAAEVEDELEELEGNESKEH